MELILIIVVLVLLFGGGGGYFGRRRGYWRLNAVLSSIGTRNLTGSRFSFRCTNFRLGEPVIAGTETKEPSDINRRRLSLFSHS
jgi:hypothetical protein